MTKTKKPTTDYIAVIFIGGGSSHGRSPDKETAIKLCLRYFRDWESVFSLPEQDLNINVWNVTGFDSLRWDRPRSSLPRRNGED